jgi:Na+-transporting NADH:ubiquinone oxidoreductase subunit NqrB
MAGQLPPGHDQLVFMSRDHVVKHSVLQQFYDFFELQDFFSNISRQWNPPTNNIIKTKIAKYKVEQLSFQVLCKQTIRNQHHHMLGYYT